ncbi:MAG: hypothetical protein WB676_31425 [Bryobacteraceae bacterium]
MQSKIYADSFLLILAALLVLSACGPPGPVFGLGPVLDHLVGLLLVVALVAGGVWGVRTASRSAAGQAIARRVSGAEEHMRDHFNSGEMDLKAMQNSRAEEILRERYARGEIDRHQYFEMSDDLKRK